ncbi:hypothetical protein DF3PB_220029 [uncultured Defluviicoccus sp.]|uniref:Uncharacterized protein n=1 Tax=metagenome TaxID=256318 RepID=A0A380TCS3_9ZZZZ|nr:hypothetical protein DF3PB_220029 [uncultured Defluviicoccus sp.]
MPLLLLLGSFLAVIVLTWRVAARNRAWRQPKSVGMQVLFPFGMLRPGARVRVSWASRLLLCVVTLCVDVVLGVMLRAST